MDGVTEAVLRVRSALAIRETALAELETGHQTGVMGHGMADRARDVAWANGVVEREADRVGKSPEWLVAAAGY